MEDREKVEAAAKIGMVPIYETRRAISLGTSETITYEKIEGYRPMNLQEEIDEADRQRRCKG